MRYQRLGLGSAAVFVNARSGWFATYTGGLPFPIVDGLYATHDGGLTWMAMTVRAQVGALDLSATRLAGVSIRSARGRRHSLRPEMVDAYGKLSTRGWSPDTLQPFRSRSPVFDPGRPDR